MKHNTAARIRRSSNPLLPAAALSVLCGLAVDGLPARGEDSDKMRSYFHLRRGEFNYAWGPEDMWGLGLGVNLNRYLGVELAIDTWEGDLILDDQGGSTLGEEAATSIIPQLRLRYPLFHDKIVPYAVAGFGGSFYQFNDRKSSGYGLEIDADGYGWAASAGAGIDFFIADNLALNLEAKQIWHSPLDVTVEGQTYTYDPTDWVATFGFRIFFQENTPRPLVSSADRAPTRIFLGFRAGGSFLTDDKLADGLSLEPEASAWGEVFNQHFGGSVGMDFGQHWGFELSADGGEYAVQVAGVGAVSEYVVSSVIPQVRLRLPISEGRWVPYFMAGVGISYGEANDYQAPSAGTTFEAEGIYPALAVAGGIEYFLARNISLGAEARWMYTWDHKFEVNGREERGDMSHLQLQLALRLYLFEFSKSR